MAAHLTSYLREEVFLGRKVVVQGPERDTGLHGHVLDLNALVLVPLQQHEAGVDDALAARQLAFGQYVRRYRLRHVNVARYASSR